MQFGMLRHVRLDEQRAPLRIETGRKVVEDDLQRVLLHGAGVGVVGRQRVPICYEEETVVLVLQLHPVSQRSNVVAEVELSGWTHAAQHTALGWFSVGHRKPRNKLSSA
jgi:hypothetical protein